MTVRDKDTLKGYFNKGDVPTEENYADLIDSMGVLSADQLYALRANTQITGGGVLTVFSDWRCHWGNRFIVICQGVSGYTANDGYFTITIPPNGTVITGVGGAPNRQVGFVDGVEVGVGIYLNVWEALYYILPLGSGNTSINANFRVVGYTAPLEIPAHWVRIAFRSGDDNPYVYWATGKIIPFNNDLAANYGQFNARYADLANNAVSSNNALALGGNAAANFVQGENNTRTSTPGTINDPLPSGFYNKSGGTGAPDANWWHYIHARHNNTVSNYAFDIAAQFYADDFRIRRINPEQAPNPQPWRRLLLALSENRKGVDRIYRRENDTDYNVQIYWNGARWVLYGYQGDTNHAGCQVAYAEAAYSAEIVRGLANGLVYVALTGGEGKIYNGGSAPAVGQYTLPMTSYGVPANAKAVYIRCSMYWASQNAGYYVTLGHDNIGDDKGVVVRANVGGYSVDGAGIVMTDGGPTSNIYMNIAGVSPGSFYVMVQGYFI